MKFKLTLKKRILFTVVVTLLVGVHIVWDHFHDGVPIHYLFHSKDMPGISNWWGLIVLPLVTWILLYLIQKSMDQGQSGTELEPQSIVYRFLSALFFGVVLSVFFTIGSEIPGYLMIGAILLSFFLPLFLPEYLLGFILGMSYTFGANLPVIFSIVLGVLFIVNYKFIRKGILYVVSLFK